MSFLIRATHSDAGQGEPLVTLFDFQARRADRSQLGTVWSRVAAWNHPAGRTRAIPIATKLIAKQHLGSRSHPDDLFRALEHALTRHRCRFQSSPASVPDAGTPGLGKVFTMTSAVLGGLGVWLPPTVVTNAELCARLETSPEWIGSRTGIAQRRVVCEGLATADLARMRGLVPDRCLVVAADVGKHTAAALVANDHGQVLGELAEFGVGRLAEAVVDVQRRVSAQSVRIGMEAAGHYHHSVANPPRPVVIRQLR